MSEDTVNDTDTGLSMESFENPESLVSETDNEPDLESSLASITEEVKEETQAQEETPEEEYDFTPPEDVKDSWDEAKYNDFKAYAKEKGIKADVFKDLISKYVDSVKGVSSKVNSDLLAFHQSNVAGWVKEIKADPEVGGANYKASNKTAVDAILAVGGKDLATELVNTGLANNPKIFKAFVKVGNILNEGKYIAGKPAVSEEEIPLHKLLYPKQ